MGEGKARTPRATGQVRPPHVGGGDGGGEIRVFEFDSGSRVARLHSIEFHGKRVWIAGEVGRALGYVQSRMLANLIRDEWARDFIPGVDVIVLEGNDLSDLRSALESAASAEFASTSLVHTNGDGDGTPETAVSPKTRSLTLLTESGFHMVCAKTDKPLGVALRRWLVDEVLPRLMRGEGIPAAGAANGNNTTEVHARPTAPKYRSAAAFAVALLNMSAAEKNAWSRGAERMRAAWVDAVKRRDPAADQHYAAWQSYASGGELAPPPPRNAPVQLDLSEAQTSTDSPVQSDSPASRTETRAAVVEAPESIDPWEHLIAAWLAAEAEAIAKRCNDGRGHVWVTVRDVVLGAIAWRSTGARLDPTNPEPTQIDLNRAARALRRLGWKPKPLRVQGRKMHCYLAPESPKSSTAPQGAA